MNTISSTYTLGYLAMHPKTKEIVYRHLKPQIVTYGIDPASVHGTLREMFDHNMGGGIPFDIIVALMKELDMLKLPLRPRVDRAVMQKICDAYTCDFDRPQRHAVAKKYLPKHIECLFIAEAPPAELRYFYFEESNDHDGLFINMMRALFDDVSEMKATEIRSRKKELLRRFQMGGYYLLDSLDFRLPSSAPNTLRKALISSNIPDIDKRLSKLPNHDHFTYFIKGSVFKGLHDKNIEHVGFTYNKGLPFPSNGNQAKFRNELRKALSARRFIWRDGDIEIIG